MSTARASLGQASTMAHPGPGNVGIGDLWPDVSDDWAAAIGLPAPAAAVSPGAELEVDAECALPCRALPPPPQPPSMSFSYSIRWVVMAA